MKKNLILGSIIFVIVLATIITTIIVAFTNQDPEDPNTPTLPAIEQIGIGGGGAFLNAMIDPTNPTNYYATCDMGGLYYSHNSGKSWGRTESVAVFFQSHMAQNGTIFVGGNGLYASYNQGKNINLIYPKNVKYSVSRCGWNENLMLADNYDNGYLKCIATTNTTVYFVTIDWEGNLRLMQCDYYGNSWQILYTEKLDYVSNPMDDITMYMCVDSHALYFSMGTYINKYTFSDNSVTNIYSTSGYIRDLEIINNQFFLIDDNDTISKIIYTSDWQNFTNILDNINLTTSFTKYGRAGTFNWHFIGLSGNNIDNLYLNMQSPVNEFNDTVEGVMKYDGSDFHWVFDNVFNTKHPLELGWSYGCHGPIYNIYASPHNHNMCLVANVESIYEMKYYPDNTREIHTLHCDSYTDGTSSTTGLNVQTTYSVKEDPFDSNHIIICTTDMGLQNSFNNGKSWNRMNMYGDDWSIYNTCYDLYFDTKTKDLVYGLWSSIHDAPYYTNYGYKDYTQGAFAVSYNGGIDWDFTYSTGIPSDAIPVKFSVVETEDEIIFAVATFNRGFYISYDSGRTFESLNAGIKTHQDLIFGEDIIMTDDTIYCLTSPILDNGNWIPSELYQYDIATHNISEIDLGEIVLARSLAYSKNHGLYINVIPDYTYEWFVEYNNGLFVNKNGGIYHYDGETVSLVASNNTGIFHSAFGLDGRLYATDTYGKLFVLNGNKLDLLVGGLFNMLKNVSISKDPDIIYVTTFGGGTYKIRLSLIPTTY